MDDARQRRIATNESRFRDANEHIVDSVDQLHEGRDEAVNLSAMCECAMTDCAEMIDLSRAEYEHVRSQPAWFVVRPGHIVREAEQVVLEREGYVIVEKVDAGRDRAEELDPRTGD